jgi:hypothetical protein
MSCSYQSVTLQPNEQFVLPPGATLIAATDTAQLDSVNDCLNLTNVETIECYGVVFGESENSSVPDPPTPVYNDVEIGGITVDNVYYPFLSNINTGSTSGDILAALNQTPFAGLFTITGMSLKSDGNRGDVLYIAFKTLPSIASTMYFSGGGTGVVEAPATSSVPVSFPVFPYAEFIALGGDFTFPPCT